MKRTFQHSETEMTVPLATWPMALCVGFISLLLVAIGFAHWMGEDVPQPVYWAAGVAWLAVAFFGVCAHRSYLHVDAEGITENYVYYTRVTRWEDIKSLKLVNDGDGADLNFQQTNNRIAANWSGFSDGCGQALTYQWAIGVVGNIESIQAFASVGDSVSAS